MKYLVNVSRAMQSMGNLWRSREREGRFSEFMTMRIMDRGTANGED